MIHENTLKLSNTEYNYIKSKVLQTEAVKSSVVILETDLGLETGLNHVLNSTQSQFRLVSLNSNPSSVWTFFCAF